MALSSYVSSQGILIFNFGLELFDPEAMNGYRGWLKDIQFPAPALMAKLGKIIETHGWCTTGGRLIYKIAAIALIITMSVVAFMMGNGISCQQIWPCCYYCYFWVYFFQARANGVSIIYFLNRKRVQSKLPLDMSAAISLTCLLPGLCPD